MKTVCIQQLDDGSFSVYEEMEATGQAIPGMPGQAAPEAEEPASQAQPAATIDEALNLARQLFGAEVGGEDKSPEALLQGGFQKARGVPAGM